MVLGAQAPGRVGRRPAFSADRDPRVGISIARVKDVRSVVHVAAAVLDCFFVVLRDGDLVLRPWTENDVDAMVAGCNDPEVAYWIPTIPHPYTADDARAFIRGDVRDDHDAMAIELDGRVVGGIGIGVNAHDHRGRLGYWVAPSERGHGTCTRALRLLSRHAIDDLELQRLELITDPDNVASQRVAEKVGYQREGVLRAHLRHPDGRIRDSVMFSLLPGELRE
jgi:RimJ/RimL family protein N-acetyltransferase